MPICGATINAEVPAGVSCQLHGGHVALHEYHHDDYTITWSLDSRVRCGSCDLLVPVPIRCPGCGKAVCAACVGPKPGLRTSCLKCRGESP